MTVKEKKEIQEVITALKSECSTLENLFLQTRSVNLRWVKQSIEEKCISKIDKMI